MSRPGLIAFLHKNLVVPVPSTNNLAFSPVLHHGYHISSTHIDMGLPLHIIIIIIFGLI